MMLTALGLMSGTSLDGVDVALIETDGKQVKAFGPTGYRPYGPAERNLLRLKGEMGKTSAEALSIVRGAQVDGWRAVLD